MRAPFAKPFPFPWLGFLIQFLALRLTVNQRQRESYQKLLPFSSQKFFFVMQGDNLQKTREELGFTQQQFAEMLGITRTYLGMVERGERPLSGKLQRKLTHILETKGNNPSCVLQEEGHEYMPDNNGDLTIVLLQNSLKEQKQIISQKDEFIAQQAKALEQFLNLNTTMQAEIELLKNQLAEAKRHTAPTHPPAAKNAAISSHSPT